MAIFCICLALWLVILAAGSERWYAELAGLSALVMALGCVTAYSYAIYSPVVLGIGFLAAVRARSLKRAVILVAWMAVILALALAVVPSLLDVWPGVFHTTLSRSITRDHQTVPAILQIAWSCAGPFTVIISAGALIAVGAARERSERFLLAALLAAAFVVPCYQILIARTGWALDKHLTPGMWCAVLAAGMGFAEVALPGLKAGAQAAAALTALSLPLFAGWYSAYGITRSWPGSGRLAAAVRPLAAGVHGNAYTEITPSLLDYYSWPASLKPAAMEVRDHTRPACRAARDVGCLLPARARCREARHRGAVDAGRDEGPVAARRCAQGAAEGEGHAGHAG